MLRHGAAAVVLVAISSILPAATFAPPKSALGQRTFLPSLDAACRVRCPLLNIRAALESSDSSVFAEGAALARRNFVGGLAVSPLLVAGRVGARDTNKAQLEGVRVIALESNDVLAEPQLAPPVPAGYSGALPTSKTTPDEVVLSILAGLRQVPRPRLAERAQRARTACRVGTSTLRARSRAGKAACVATHSVHQGPGAHCACIIPGACCTHERAPRCSRTPRRRTTDSSPSSRTRRCRQTLLSALAPPPLY